MINVAHSAALVAVISIVTALLRFLPFLIFGGKGKTPSFITYLGEVLPFAIMGMLVVYSLKDVSITSGSHGLPELIACAVVAALHIWRKNTLISMAGGTLCYMLLVQLVF